MKGDVNLMSHKFSLMSLLVLGAMAFMVQDASARIVVSGNTNPGDRNRVQPGRYIPGGNMPVYRPVCPHRQVMPPPAPRPRYCPPAPRPKVKSPDRYTADGYLKPSTKKPHRVQDGPLRSRR